MNLSTNPLFTHGIQKLCTICHVILRDTDTGQSIFSTLEELEAPMNVLHVLQSFSNFNFYNDAQMVCTTCCDKTIEVYKFIQMCNKAHDNMQHYLKNIEAIKTIKEVERDEPDVYVKIEEISTEPSRIIIDGWKFVEEMDNEKINKIDEMEMVISGTEIKIEERILQGMAKEETSRNEGKTIDNLKVAKIDAQTHNERIGLIKCKDCHLMFSDKKKLDDHRKEAKHTKEKPFFGTKYHLRSHDQGYDTKRAHISKDLRRNKNRPQPLRGEEFYNDKRLKIHRKTHKKKFLCNDCGKVFTTQHYLNTHNRVHIGVKPFTSGFAEQTFLYEHNGVKAHKCTNLSNLRRDMNSYNGEKAHKCEQCDRRFARASYLRSHMDIHNGVKPHKCGQCDRRFTQAANLRSHMHMHNGVKAHRCEQCDRRFSRASYLRIHMDIHNAIKAHICEQCDRRYTNLSNLRRHMNSHNGVKAYKCEQCDRRFTQSSSLRRHMDSHNGVKVHKCEQCDRRFTQASDLRRHMDCHNGVKLHKCEQCDRRFARASHLRSHMDIHNGVKAHKCEQCDRRFTQAANLRSHMDMHNEVKSHKCDQCDRRFCRASYLRSHMDIHNGVKAAKRTNANNATGDSPKHRTCEGI